MANDSWFQTPNINDSKGYLEFFQYISSATEGMFFAVILLVIWIVSFIAMLFSGSYQRPSAAKAWIFASFFTVVLSIPLAVLDLLASKYMYISIVLLGIGVLWIIIEGGE